MTPRLSLTEYVSRPEVALEPDQRDALCAVFTDMTVAPTTGSTGRYDLTPGSHVGVAEFQNLIVEVNPKIKFDRLMFVLSYALDPRLWDSVRTVPIGEARSVVEAVVPSFVHHVRKALLRGVLQGYRSVDEAGLTIRGRVRFGDQIRRRFGLPLPVEISYDDFTEDIVENRLIRAAISLLRRITLRSEQSRLALREFDTALERVSEVRYDKRAMPFVTFTRVNERYRAAVELARLIIRSFSLELGPGQRGAVSFVVDMNDAFENFVVVALRESLRLSQSSFPQNNRGHRLVLDERGDIELLPDFAWWDGGRCVFVGDAKYKALTAVGFKHPDVYQMLAYLTATSLPEGLLVYGEAPQAHVEHVLVNGKRVRVAALDLAQTPDQVLRQISALGDFIRAHRLAPFAVA